MLTVYCPQLFTALEIRSPSLHSVPGSIKPLGRPEVRPGGTLLLLWKFFWFFKWLKDEVECTEKKKRKTRRSCFLTFTLKRKLEYKEEVRTCQREGDRMATGADAQR
jgi:hypothetical protein